MGVLIRIIVIRRVTAGKTHIKALTAWKAGGTRRNGMHALFT